MNDVKQLVLQVLDEVLNLDRVALLFTEETKRRGALPQLYTMAVVSLTSALEECMGLSFPEEDLDGTLFDSVGTLVAYVKKPMTKLHGEVDSFRLLLLRHRVRRPQRPAAAAPMWSGNASRWMPTAPRQPAGSPNDRNCRYGSRTSLHPQTRKP